MSAPESAPESNAVVRQANDAAAHHEAAAERVRAYRALAGLYLGDASDEEMDAAVVKWWRETGAGS